MELPARWLSMTLTFMGLLGATSCQWFSETTGQKSVSVNQTTELQPLGDDAEPVVFRNQGKVPSAPFKAVIGANKLPDDSVSLFLWATAVPSYPNYLDLTGQALVPLADPKNPYQLFLVRGECDSAHQVYRIVLKSVEHDTETDTLEIKLVPLGGEATTAKPAAAKPVLLPLAPEAITELKNNLSNTVANLSLNANDPKDTERSQKSILIGVGKDPTEFRLFFDLNHGNKNGKQEKGIQLQPKTYLTSLRLTNPDYPRPAVAFKQYIDLPKPFLLKSLDNPDVNAVNETDIFGSLKNIVEVVDFNLDGYMDLKVLQAQFPQREVYRLLVYSPDQKLFIDYGRLVNPELDDQKGLLTTTDNDVTEEGVGASSWITRLKYTVADSRLRLHQAEQARADGKGQPRIFVRQNGQWQALAK
jgi:hypothetical protein